MRNLLLLPERINPFKNQSESRSTLRKAISVAIINALVFLFAFLPSSFLFGQTVIVFPSTTTWTCPAGVTSIQVECWGGGGAGGGARGNPSAGGGGAGGSYVKNTSISVIPGTTYTVTVAAAVNGTTNNGANGNDSWFNSAATIMAKGGLGGPRANSNNQTAAGAAKITSGNVGFEAPFSYYGGAGGTGGAFGASGGGGGSSAGTGSDGNNAPGMTGGAAVTGGGAGVDGSTSSADGPDNTNIGGGGAGARAGSATDRTGGNGGPGQIIITYNNCPASTAITPVAAQSVCIGASANTLTANVTLSGGQGSPSVLYQWYYNTSNTNNIGTATLIGGATASTYTPTTGVAGTRYYFCVGYATNNSCGQTNATQLLASNTVAVTVNPSMSGTYNVGPAQVYTTLTAAVAAYNSACLSGPVTFVLTGVTYSGSETFPITINENATASSTNTLTIRPNTGGNPSISGSVNNAAVIRIRGKYVTIDGSNNGSSSRNLTITNTSGTSPNILLIGSTGTTPITDVTVKNCTLINGVNTSSGILVSDGAIPGSAGYFYDITIQNNSIQKCWIGLYCRAANVGNNGNGLTITSNNLSTSGANAIRRVGLYVQDVYGATLSNNTIGNFETASTEFDMGIWFAAGTRNSTVTGNTISNLAYTGASNTGPNGIFVSTNTDNSNLVISNNTITNISSVGSVPSGGDGAASGINIDFASSGGVIYGNKISNIKNTHASGYGCNGIQLSATAIDAEFTIYNNFIFDIASRGSTTSRNYDRNGHGIVITDGGGYRIYNNTVLMNTNQLNSGYPSAMTIAAAVVNPSSIYIQNNIFVNTQTQAGERYAIQSEAANTVFAAIDNNDYYTAGTNLGYISATNRTNLAAIQAGFGSNTSSLNLLPVFISATDLHLQTSPHVNEALNYAGAPISGITADIDAQTRNVFTPDIGADEFRGRGSWVGTTSTSWTTASNWFDNYIPLSTTHVEISGTATFMPVISASTHPLRNLVIETGGSLTVNGTGILQVAGKMGNSGTFNMANGTIELNSTTEAQVIPANTFQSNSVKNLIISNTDNVTGVTLGGTLDVYESVTFGAAGRKLTTGGFLSFKSTASGTAWLGPLTGSNTITGDATVERYIPLHAKAWQFLAAPTSGQTINAAWQEGNTPLSSALNPAYGTLITNHVAGTGFDIIGGTGPSMKTYDSATHGWVGIANTTIPIYNSKGYMVFVRGDRTASSVSGPTTTANLRTKGTLFTPANPPSVINLSANTFESVGNPYPSAIDMTALSLSGGVQDVFYVWDPKVTTSPSAYGLGAYQTFTRNGATYDVTPGGGSYPGGTSKTIESGQAFFVRAPAAVGSVTFTEGCKVSGSSDVNRAPVSNASQLRTNLYVITGNNRVLLDGNMVQYDRLFSNSIDMDDAVKLGNTGENLGIKSQGSTLVVERRSPVVQTDTIFYNMGQVRVKQYEFELIPRRLSQEGMEAYLEDRYLGTRTAVSLQDTTRVLFNVVNVPGSYATDRFRVVFKVKKKIRTKPVPTAYEMARGNNGQEDAAFKSKTDQDTNLPEEMNKPGVDVFPNPVINKSLHLKFTNIPAGEYNLVLIHSNGMKQQLNAIQISAGKTVQKVNLPISIIPGIYQLHFTGNDNLNLVKVINVL